jgi:DNA-directed RNA polymerase I subunit RPA49
MLDKLPGCPTQLLNGLLTRFAEKSGKKYTSTEKTKTKLLAWMCTVYLHLDGFSVSVERVAKELNLAPGK